MAQKLNRKPSATQAETVDVINEGVAEEKTATPSATKKTTETKKEAPKAPKKFSDTDTIPCRSCTAGELIMVGKKTNNLYTWSNYDDVSEVEFSDLRSAILTKSSFIFKPRFIIEDEDVLAQWPNVKEAYSNMYSAEDINKLFSLPVNRFERALNELPAGIKDSIKNIAADKIANGELDSINKIKAIDRVLGTELLLIATE